VLVEDAAQISGDLYEGRGRGWHDGPTLDSAESRALWTLSRGRLASGSVGPHAARCARWSPFWIPSGQFVLHAVVRSAALARRGLRPNLCLSTASRF
jgi:hypothetical protein